MNETTFSYWRTYGGLPLKMFADIFTLGREWELLSHISLVLSICFVQLLLYATNTLFHHWRLSSRRYRGNHYGRLQYMFYFVRQYARNSMYHHWNHHWEAANSRCCQGNNYGIFVAWNALDLGINVNYATFNILFVIGIVALA